MLFSDSLFLSLNAFLSLLPHKEHFQENRAPGLFPSSQLPGQLEISTPTSEEQKERSPGAGFLAFLKNNFWLFGFQRPYQSLWGLKKREGRGSIRVFIRLVLKGQNCIINKKESFLLSWVCRFKRLNKHFSF